MNRKLTTRELFYFCEQFSLILRSGMSSIEGLQILMEENPSKESKDMFGFLLKTLEETGRLSEALKSSGLFPASMISYVKVGEETGCLDEIMGSLASHYQQEMEIAEHIRHSLTYPLIMLGMMGAVIIILLVKVLPVFQQVFRQMGLEMSGLSSGLLSIGSAISRYSVILLLFLLLIILCTMFFCFHPKGRQVFKHFIYRIPYIREIPLFMDYGRMAHGISLGLRSGLGPDTSLTLSRGLVSHPVVTKRLEQSLHLLEEGTSFCDALTESGLFGGMDARLICIGFHGGAADEVMERLSSRYQEDSAARLGHMLSVIEPTIVILLSLMVGIVLMSVMIPLLGILSDMLI